MTYGRMRGPTGERPGAVFEPAPTRRGGRPDRGAPAGYDGPGYRDDYSDPGYRDGYGDPGYRDDGYDDRDHAGGVPINGVDPLTSAVRRPVRRPPPGRLPRRPAPSVRRAAERARAAAAARKRRRSRLIAVLALVAAVGLAGGALAGRAWLDNRRAPGAGVPPPGTGIATIIQEPTGTPAGPSGSATPGTSVTTVPQDGPGTFSYATTASPIRGTAGPVRQYQIAVENDIGQDVTAFAERADRILGDRRSWIGGGALRVQRVAKGTAADFTIFLATPVTSEAMCAAGGLRTDRFTSCRLNGKVIINLARWLTAIRGYGAPVDVYQVYALNHEVGHQLGQGHEGCPGAGRIAPVMQQQTLGLKGCVANGWPYLDGKRYRGPSVP